MWVDHVGAVWEWKVVTRQHPIQFGLSRHSRRVGCGPGALWSVGHANLLTGGHGHGEESTWGNSNWTRATERLARPRQQDRTRQKSLTRISSPRKLARYLHPGAAAQEGWSHECGWQGGRVAGVHAKNRTVGETSCRCCGAQTTSECWKVV